MFVIWMGISVRTATLTLRDMPLWRLPRLQVTWPLTKLQLLLDSAGTNWATPPSDQMS